MMQTGYLWELQYSPHYDAYLLFISYYCFFTLAFRHNACDSSKRVYSIQVFYYSVMCKRKRLNQQRSVNFKKPKARVLIGKPNQSDMNIALQLREVSEYLSSNGFPSTAQFIDVTKPEPVRMDFDISMISPCWWNTPSRNTQ